MKPRILLVEDEPSIAAPLVVFLEREGFALSVASNIATARAIPQAELVILDWMLPDGQGIDLLKQWRTAGAVMPVIFLTARAELIDKVLGLELGADDYITKPFEPRELLARIKARLRVSTTSATAIRPKLSCAGILLDDDARLVTYHGAAVDLTRMEYELLKLFVENQGKVFSRDEILNKVWGYDAYPTTRTVDTHVLQLRQKFAPELFETVRGVGYRLAASKI